MATKTIPQAQTFDLKKLELLSQGRTTEILAQSDMVTITGKVYAEGGENALHTHAKQDHGFLVVAGEATFHDENDQLRVCGQFEGILLPAGSFYWFQSTGDTNLVMMRFAGELAPGQNTPDRRDDRVALDGHQLLGDSLENKTVERITIPDKTFADLL